MGQQVGMFPVVFLMGYTDTSPDRSADALNHVGPSCWYFYGLRDIRYRFSRPELHFLPRVYLLPASSSVHVILITLVVCVIVYSYPVRSY